MILNLNPDSKLALYRQVYQRIKERILSQELTPGKKLPSKRLLAQQNGVSQNTIINAYNQLLEEGYIIAHERKGYYVANIQYLAQPMTRDITFSLPNKTSASLLDLSSSSADSSLFPYPAFRRLAQKAYHPSSNLLAVNRDESRFGLSNLRHALQNYLKQARGVHCHPDQIIIGPSSQWLFQVLFYLLKDHREIGIENPGYQRLNPYFKSLGKKIKYLDLDHHGAILSQSFAKKSLIYLTPNHQFPTGVIMPLERRQDFISWLAQSPDHYLIEDDYDSEYKYSGHPIPSLKELDTHDQVIYMGSFSRNLSTQLRTSYMVLPLHLTQQIAQIKDLISPASNVFNQWILAQFILNGQFERHLNRSRLEYKKRRELIIDQLIHVDPKVELLGDQAGLHLLFKPSLSFNSHQLKQDLLSRQIQIQTLADFGYKRPQMEQSYLFISYSHLPQEQIPTLISQIYQVLAIQTFV
ncbi:PLP-dependent aminotransferase family protein [Vaginisenegalia massiliensis]|uniref:MocR-like pyridoxine biosynthesis transcription factor PdxR n=1 Tax=Vaginisenegalia massiliensis TaxID=2058294 RepID=UPI000F51B6D2|nr:PLP-dependent aminotransferase family protein [Vaginisenegalia massiliensis]